MVVNAEGSIGDISFELKDTLDFIAGKEPQSEYAKDLQKAVEEVKHSEKWRALNVRWTFAQCRPEWNGDRIYDITDER